MGPVWVWLGGYEAPPKLTAYGGAILVLALIVHGYVEGWAEYNCIAASGNRKTTTQLLLKMISIYILMTLRPLGLLLPVRYMIHPNSKPNTYKIESRREDFIYINLSYLHVLVFNANATIVYLQSIRRQDTWGSRFLNPPDYDRSGWGKRPPVDYRIKK